MNAGLSLDAQYRHQALQVNRSMIVQAPAGSGKTTLLVQRYLTLLATVERPEQVVVITFTRKATGELRDRVLAALQQAADGQQDPGDLLTELAVRVLARDAEKNWELLQLPSRLGIYTIDALCAVLVRQMPWLAGLGGLARIEEQPERFYQQAAENVLAGLNAKRAVSEDLVRVFEHLDNDLASMRGLLVRMLARREQWTPYLQAGTRPDTGLRESLQQGLALIIEGQLALLNTTLPSACSVALQELVVAVAEGIGGDGDNSALAGIKVLPGATVEDLPAWRALARMLLMAKNDSLRKRDLKPQALQGLDKETRREINARARILLPELAQAEGFTNTLITVASLPDAAFTELEWQLLASLLEVLKIALAELRLIFAREGSVDFSEITNAALQALGPDDTPTDLGLALDYRIQHLLVDEFQDTSRAHYELVERLSAGFMGDDGRSLFLVGDPMQSIYRFREAEVGLFLDCMQGAMADIELHHLILQANFRSRPALVAWVNETFAKVFPATHDASRSCVAYAPAQAQRQASTATAVTLHGFLDAGSHEQAQRVAEIVRRARQTQPRHSIAVLVRSRAHLEFILPALAAAGLRYRGVDIEHLATLPVVRDLHALTRALLQPADRMSWLALLHSPWCGLQLSDLYALVGDDWETCVPVLLDDSVRRGRLGKAARVRLDSFLKALAGARTATRSLRLKRRVEACWIAFAGPSICDPDQVRDAQRYFELLDTLEADGSRLDLDRLARRLDDLYAGPHDGEADLDVMTMHKAKGLEFDQVIVPYLEKQPRSADPPLLQWSEVAFPGGSALVFAAKPAAGKDAHRYQFVTTLEAQKQRNESARLLYVACTRAREQLHLLYGLNSGSKEELRSPVKTTLLAHLWPVLQPQLEAQLEPATADEASQAPLAQGGLPLTRLSRGWQMPAMGETLAWRAGMELPEFGSGADLEFDWAGQSARHVGSVVHRLLGEIAVQGLAAWSARRVADQLPDFTRELEHLGVPSAQLKAAGGQVVEALVKTLADERGRWLLAADHIDARCELPLCGLIAGRVHSVHLDRSFVDANNVRWIIDYKTGRHGGADLQGFLDVEQQRYASQLQRYGEIMQHLDPRPIRLGLYFPLVSGWREWAFRRDGT